MSRTRKRAAPASAPASGFGALSADAHTVLLLLLQTLPVFERARAAVVCRAWRDAASAPGVWARINLESCADKVDTRALVALCTRAGAALTELLVPPCQLLTTGALLYALRTGGCVGLRTLTLPQPSDETTRYKGFPPLKLALLGDAAARVLRLACPALEKLTATLVCTVEGEVAAAAQLHPGASFALSVLPSNVLGEEGTRRSAELSHPSVTSVHMRCPFPDDGLTEEAAVALAELAMPPDTEQRDGAESAESKRAPLTCLELIGSAVGDASAAAVAAALRAPRCALRELQFWGTALTDVGASDIADALADNTSLRTLILRSFNHIDVIGDMVARALAAAMRVNSNLCVLKVGGEFSNAACADLFSGLAGHAGLRTLELRNRGTEAMGGSVGCAFGAALRAPSCRLESVMLQFAAGFEPDASAALGAGLAANTCLCKLQIWNDCFEEMPASQLLGMARALSSALLVNTTLQSLDLADLDGRAMVALAPALAVHPSLTKLDFSFGPIGDVGAAALARALAAPTCACVHLGVRYCHIDGRGGEAFADVLRHNTRLEKLDARNNFIPSNTIGKALRANAASRLNTLAVDQTQSLRVLTTALDLRGVTSLSLNNFSLGYDAATLATMLSQPRCALRKLRFSLRGGFSRGNVVSLTSGLSRNTSLTRLDIDESRFDVSDAKTLGRALRGHPRLSVLQFDRSKWCSGAAPALLRALCADDGDADDESFDALSLVFLDFRGEHPLSGEDLKECFTLANSRQPYALSLLRHAML